MLEMVYAQTPGVSTTVSNPISWASNLAVVFALVINLVIGVAVALAVIFLIMGGIKYITSGGDAKAADAARSAITNAVIGLVVAIAALAVRAIVGNILGANNVGTPNVTPNM